MKFPCDECIIGVMCRDRYLTECEKLKKFKKHQDLVIIINLITMLILFTLGTVYILALCFGMINFCYCVYLNFKYKVIFRDKIEEYLGF